MDKRVITLKACGTGYVVVSTTHRCEYPVGHFLCRGEAISVRDNHSSLWEVKF